MKTTIRTGISRAVFGALVAIGLAGATAAPAQTLASLPRTPPVVQATGEARPIAAWTDFCRAHLVE